MHRSFLLILAALLPVAACGGKHSGDTDTGSSGGSDTGDTGGDDSGKDTTDSDTSGGDTDTSTDTSTDTGAQAAEDKSGAAVQTDGTSYSGTETWSLTADGGDGAILCQVQYTLSSTAVRTDCSDCSWAYDLVISDATLVTESGVGCAALDITDDDVSTLNGTTVS